MAYTAVPTVTAGDVWTAGNHNTYIRDNFADVVLAKAARVRHDANQAVATATWTTLAFNTEDYDTDVIHDTVTNNSRLTCKTAGIYTIGGMIAYPFVGTNGMGLQILLNGATIIAMKLIEATAGGAGSAFDVSTTYSLSVNDYIQLQAYQNTGSPYNVLAVEAYSPSFWMFHVGNAS